MKVRFLLDENLSPRLIIAIRKYSDQIDVIHVGDDGAPHLGTKDPDILTYLEIAHRLLVTNNRKSMPGHLVDHLNKGGHHWGVARVRDSANWTKVVEEIAMLWVASDAEEWFDRDFWIPQ